MKIEYLSFSMLSKDIRRFLKVNTRVVVCLGSSMGMVVQLVVTSSRRISSIIYEKIVISLRMWKRQYIVPSSALKTSSGASLKYKSPILMVLVHVLWSSSSLINFAMWPMLGTLVLLVLVTTVLSSLFSHMIINLVTRESLIE
jgi:hypothetical protein